MIRSSSRWFLGAFVGLSAGVITSATPSCGDLAASSGGGFGGGFAGATSAGTGGDAGVITPDGDMPPQRFNYSAYCGDGRCVPGDSSACNLSASVGVGGAGGSDSASSSGTSGSATSSSGTSGSGGASQSGTSAGAGGGSPNTSGSGSGITIYGCQVSPLGPGPTSVCAPVGTGDVNAPCQSAADCEPGLGCTTDTSATQPSVALCRPYCCGDFELCPAKTYCAKEPMAENPDREIPVCMGVTPCQLLTNDGACGPTQTCAVVRADQTTSCIDKGTGEYCEACPCAPGFECNASGICQKLCHTATTQTNGECGLGSCQGGSTNLPSGFGLCVGGDADCSHK